MTGRHRAAGDRAKIGLPAVTVVAVLALAIVSVVAITRATGRTASPMHPFASSTPRSPVTVGSAATRAAATRAAATAPPPAQPWLRQPQAGVAGHLRAGSHPEVLPSAVLIVDKFNNRLIVVDPVGRIRWEFPQPGDLTAGETFLVPDDAFFTPDSRYIIATQEDQAVITLIDVAAHRIVYRYGVPGQPGMTANHLSNPDDAMTLPNGYLLTADIKNCRLLLIAPGAHEPARVIGRSTTTCRHDPPARWGSPNGVFPMTNGHYLVTEINGDWVDEIGLNGTIFWSAHPPGLSYPSDSNQIGPDRFLTVDYTQPGQVVIFDHTGGELWSYRGSGKDRLDHPSLALPLPNGDVVLNDDFNHRVIVIDPHTNAIVWQYGTTGVAGSGPGLLNNPDGIDLVPPQSLLITHRETMGLWPAPPTTLTPSGPHTAP
jgi:hypothetical protein